MVSNNWQATQLSCTWTPVNNCMDFDRPITSTQAINLSFDHTIGVFLPVDFCWTRTTIKYIPYRDCQSILQKCFKIGPSSPKFENSHT